jgi:hypothetical protein
MLPLGLALFCTNPFNILRYCSIGYIQRVWTQPHNCSSSTKCNKRCVMMSNKEGVNSFSNETKQISTSFLSFPNYVESTILLHNLLKTQHKHIIDILQPVDIRPHMHKGKCFASSHESHVTSYLSNPCPW